VKTIRKRKGSVNELHGMLGFIDSIDVYNLKNVADATRALKDLDERPLSSNELVYRRFLIYKDFYAAETPVAICEGETDTVYLTHAIRSLAAEFPELADVSSSGRIRLKIRLYKYPQTSTGHILGLHDGGSSLLTKFISIYRNETNRFTAEGLKNPVIILHDNDSGAKGIRGAIRHASKMNVTGAEPFLHVVNNMYAVPTPLLNGATESKIEDFFDPPTRAVVIDGKTFNDKNKFDIEKHYGKKVFAHKVIRPQAESIDFRGFRPLLTNLVAVIKAYAAARPIDALAIH
jgi:RNA-directed DNA polymerase